MESGGKTNPGEGRVEMSLCSHCELLDLGGVKASLLLVFLFCLSHCKLGFARFTSYIPS